MSKREVFPVTIAQAGRCIHNHAPVHAYPPNILADVPGVVYSGARVLASTSVGDIVQLNPDIRDKGLGTAWIQAHYGRVGLPVAENFVFDESLEVAGQYPNANLSVLLYGKRVSNVRSGSVNATLTERMHDKNHFIKLCMELDIPVPETQCVDSVEQAFRLRPPQYPVYVKGAAPAFGRQVIRCNSDEEFKVAITKIDGPLQIQEVLPDRAIFCNFQYQTDETEEGPMLVRGVVTEKRVGYGNIFPTTVNPVYIWMGLNSLARHLFGQDVKGFLTFSVAIVDDRFYVLGCKPRWTEAVYCSLPATQLGITEWESVRVATRHTNFAPIDTAIKCLEYNPTTRKGIVIINWATILSGKLGLLVAGKPAERQEIIATFLATCT